MLTVWPCCECITLSVQIQIGKGQDAKGQFKTKCKMSSSSSADIMSDCCHFRWHLIIIFYPYVPPLHLVKIDRENEMRCCPIFSCSFTYTHTLVSVACRPADMFLTIAFLIRPVIEQQGFHCPLNLAAQQSIPLAWLRGWKAHSLFFSSALNKTICDLTLLNIIYIMSSLFGEGGVEFLKRGTITPSSLVCYHWNT